MGGWFGRMLEHQDVGGSRELNRKCYSKRLNGDWGYRGFWSSKMLGAAGCGLWVR